MTVLIRHGVTDDLVRLTEIYNHYVVHTSITFDLQPKTLADREVWFSQFGKDSPYQLFVALQNNVPVGYAYSAKFREKQAYETSVESTIYLDHELTAKGLGTRLYATLFDALKSHDVHRVYAGVTQPNPASVALHEKMGFRQVGVFKEVGRKFDQYWDVHWYEKELN